MCCDPSSEVFKSIWEPLYISSQSSDFRLEWKLICLAWCTLNVAKTILKSFSSILAENLLNRWWFYHLDGIRLVNWNGFFLLCLWSISWIWQYWLLSGRIRDYNCFFLRDILIILGDWYCCIFWLKIILFLFIGNAWNYLNLSFCILRFNFFFSLNLLSIVNTLLILGYDGLKSWLSRLCLEKVPDILIYRTIKWW